MTAMAVCCAAPPAGCTCNGRASFAGIIRSPPNSWCWRTASRFGFTTRILRKPTCATPASLLSGVGSVSAQFNVTALPPSAGLQWFQLVPKHADTDFQVVRIGFDKGELRSMFLADKLNQITQLTFSNSKRNLSLAPDLFTFVPPPGVDVIGRGQ